MRDPNDIIVATVQRIFRDCGDPQTVSRLDDLHWRDTLWAALDETGLTRAWVAGEVDTTLADGFAILEAAGGAAVSVPLAETMLAGWLLSRAGIAAPMQRVLAVAPTGWRDRIVLADDGTLSGAARAVAFASEAHELAVLCHRAERCYVALVSARNVHIEAATNIAGDALDTISLRNVQPIACGEAIGITHESLLMMGATAHAMQMAGALQAVLDLSVSYAEQRIAFERPIAKFQVIQHNLARLAGEVAAAVAAASSAADAISSTAEFDAGVLLEVASAKVRVGEAVAVGAGIAHQVHGAIGFSQEHVLNRYTRRLWSWRDDFGSEAQWAVRLGQAVTAAGADALWPLLASR